MPRSFVAPRALGLTALLLALAACGGGDSGPAVSLSSGSITYGAGHPFPQRVSVAHHGGKHLLPDFAPGQDTSAASCMCISWVDWGGEWWVEPCFNGGPPGYCTVSTVVWRINLVDEDDQAIAFDDLVVHLE